MGVNDDSPTILIQPPSKLMAQATRNTILYLNLPNIWIAAKVIGTYIMLKISAVSTTGITLIRYAPATWLATGDNEVCMLLTVVIDVKRKNRIT